MRFSRHILWKAVGVLARCALITPCATLCILRNGWQYVYSVTCQPWQKINPWLLPLPNGDGYVFISVALLWRHNGHEGVSNHQPNDCLGLLNRLIQAQIKENIKAPRHWPLCREVTGDRWILCTKGKQLGKCFHLMTSSWVCLFVCLCFCVSLSLFVCLLFGC